MRGRWGKRGIAALASAALAGSAAALSPGLPDQQRQLAAAKRQAAVAAERADRLAAAAAQERNAAARARAEERALAGRVSAAEADLVAARARAALVATLVARQQARLAEAQTPVTGLLAALQSLARRPAIVAVAQPGSVEDMVHLRAVLGSTLPAIRARTAGLRDALSATRALAREAGAAAAALRAGRVTLEAERTRLARLEARHRAQAAALGRHAASEADRALALGERARDLVDRLDEEGVAEATAGTLAQLPGPVMRPLASGAVLPRPLAGAYRLPVAGRLVTGFDEVSASGVRSRGLTFAVRPGATAVAPAGGVVRYARGFRDYGVVVIIDHGEGWSTLVTGLAAAAVRPGQAVAPGLPLGRANTGDEPRITVELRRRGRPVDIVALLG